MTKKIECFSQSIFFNTLYTTKKTISMPNIINSPSYQEINFIPNNIDNNLSYDDLSSWITYLLIQELSENNPITTEIITNYINNINDSPNDTPNDSPNDTPNDTPNDSPNDTPNDSPNDTPNDSPNGYDYPSPHSTIILNHDDDQDLYDTDYSSDDNSPIGIYESSNHNIP